MSRLIFLMRMLMMWRAQHKMQHKMTEQRARSRERESVCSRGKNVSNLNLFPLQTAMNCVRVCSLTLIRSQTLFCFRSESVCHFCSFLSLWVWSNNYFGCGYMYLRLSYWSLMPKNALNMSFFLSFTLLLSQSLICVSWRSSDFTL